jgi:hypothetical protein
LLPDKNIFFELLQGSNKIESLWRLKIAGFCVGVFSKKPTLVAYAQQNCQIFH